MKDRVSFILTMILFGSIGLFVRQIPLASGQIALLRGLIGGLFLFIASILSKKRISMKAIKSNFPLLLLSGTAIGFNWIFLFEAYQYTSITNATLSYYFAPVFVMLLSPFLLKEKLRKANVISVIGAVIGMFFIVGNNSTGIAYANHGKGIAFGIMAAILYACVILMNKFLKNIAGIEMTMVQLFVAAVVLLPYLVVTKTTSLQNLSGASLALIAVVGIIHTGIAYLVYFTSIQKLKTQSIAVFSYIDPIAAILLSSLFLGENFGFRHLFGGILILGASFYNEMAKPRTKE